MQNVTQILRVGAFTWQLLCEQVVGRSLRRLNYDDFSEPEHVEV
jgi:type III restriction enzyme